jgi:hypothetical protein
MRIGIAVLLGGVLALGCTTRPVATPVVIVPSGVATRMTPQQVEAQVIALIHANEAIAGQILRPPRVVSMTAQGSTGGVLWDVQAEGTFTTNRYPPGASPGVSATGHYLISDSDGGVISYGYP